MKTKLFITAGLISVSLIILMGVELTAFEKNAPQDVNACVEKYGSGWGSFFDNCPADYQDSYHVKMKNTCEEAIDLKCCVQQKFKSWKCEEKQNLTKNDTLVVHACKGTGKYLFWTRKAGDVEILFPSDEEVDNTYKD